MFRFTIRDVLWLTVVVGMGAEWWIDHCTVEAKRQEAILRSWDLRIDLEFARRRINVLGESQ
jgi:hypothetical protein